MVKEMNLCMKTTETDTQNYISNIESESLRLPEAAAAKLLFLFDWHDRIKCSIICMFMGTGIRIRIQFPGLQHLAGEIITWALAVFFIFIASVTDVSMPRWTHGKDFC